MATAPRPGSTPNSNEVRQREQNLKMVVKITVRDDQAMLRYSDLGPADAQLVREQTGVTLRKVVGAFFAEENDYDYIAIAYWLAKHKSGNHVPYETIRDGFPSYAEIGQVKIHVDFEDAERTDDDPLPSGGPSTGPQ